MSACVAGGSCIGSRRGFGSSGRGIGRVGDRPVSLSFPRNRAISAAASVVRSTPASAGRVAERLEHWMRESVVEIVRSLGSGEAAAPLLVHVYGGDEAEESRIRTDRAGPGDWCAIKGRWGSGEEPSPEGIILVEELKDGEEAEEGNLVNSNTKAWGVLLMGRGEEGGAASYLLKTTRGGSHSQLGRGGGGLSCNCTHFSLVKVKSFTESTRSQLNNCWLVN